MRVTRAAASPERPPSRRPRLPPSEFAFKVPLGLPRRPSSFPRVCSLPVVSLSRRSRDPSLFPILTRRHPPHAVAPASHSATSSEPTGKKMLRTARIRSSEFHHRPPHRREQSTMREQCVTFTYWKDARKRRAVTSKNLTKSYAHSLVF